MEERVGILWHRLINRLAERHFHAAAVELKSLSKDVGVMFRALGGAHGVAVRPGAGTLHGAVRPLLQRLAGCGTKADLAWVDQEALRLPQTVDIFPEKALNEDLYFWLAALCAFDRRPDLPWFARNQAAAMAVVDSYPGLAASYRRLVEASIALRPPVDGMPRDEAGAEHAIRSALRRPGTVAVLPPSRKPPFPVLLWLRPDAPVSGRPRPVTSFGQSSDGAGAEQADNKRRVAEQAEMPERQGGLMMFRPESIFSWTEYARVEHAAQENEDQDLGKAADDLDIISIAEGQRRTSKKLRMELDLPAAAIDDTLLEGDRLLPEWDYRTGMLKPEQCRVNVMPQDHGRHCELPRRLRLAQRKLRRQFEALTPVRLRAKAQPEGDEIDLDPYIRHLAQPRSGEARFYSAPRRRERDLACLLLADLSLSTEASIEGDRRVIDVIRDSLLLFSETLAATKDRFALYGFNSCGRRDVSMHTLKSFGDAYDDRVRGRIDNIGPANYTRMGAAIRWGGEVLARQKARDLLLLLLTDGKPNDSDHYEGRYGIEDTRKALATAKQQGLRPFCVTIDQEAHEYLPHIFGRNHFTIIRRPSELPARLPLLYAQLTR